MLRFADDIVFLAESRMELEKMLNDKEKLCREEIRFKINKSKKKCYEQLDMEVGFL